MQKTCQVCETKFNTKEGRQKTCSNKCGNVLRKTNAKKPFRGVDQTPLFESSLYNNPFRGVDRTPLFESSPTKPTEPSLPDPEELPAPYAKRVYDMWAALIGEKDSIKRIA